MKTIEVFHADSLAGPVGKLKKAFEKSISNCMISLIKLQQVDSLAKPGIRLARVVGEFVLRPGGSDVKCRNHLHHSL